MLTHTVKLRMNSRVRVEFHNAEDLISEARSSDNISYTHDQFSDGIGSLLLHLF